MTRFPGLPGTLRLHAPLTPCYAAEHVTSSVRAGLPARLRAAAFALISPCEVHDRFRKWVDTADERPRILAA